VTIFRRVHVFFILQFRDGHITLVFAFPPLVGRASFFGFSDFRFGGKLIFYVSHDAVFELQANAKSRKNRMNCGWQDQLVNETLRKSEFSKCV